MDTEAVRLLAASAAFFAGLAAATGILAVMHRGDGHGGRRSAAAMVAASVAVATAALTLVQALTTGVEAGRLAWYAGAGGILGLATGLFPLAAGLPLFLAAAAAIGLSAAALSPWVTPAAGIPAARLSVFPATASGSRVALTLAAPRGRHTELDLSVSAGQLHLVFATVRIQGPLSVLYGRFRYLPLWLESPAMSTPVLRAERRGLLTLPGAVSGSTPDRSPAAHTGTVTTPLPQPAVTVLRALGCTFGSMATGPLVPEDFITMTCSFATDGTLACTLD